ncbi:MAG: hypothetical protein KAH32_00100 [Chlamydiia bacterium]|nr:hypothetical protein [Chlamydiia bacterium]
MAKKEFLDSEIRTIRSNINEVQKNDVLATLVRELLKVYNKALHKKDVPVSIKDIAKLSKTSQTTSAKYLVVINEMNHGIDLYKVKSRWYMNLSVVKVREVYGSPIKAKPKGRCIREGKVAVILSTSKDGWFTMNEDKKNSDRLIFSPKLVEMIENNRAAEITEEWLSAQLQIDDANCNSSNLVIEWVPLDNKILIETYDGIESLRLLSDDKIFDL